MMTIPSYSEGYFITYDNFEQINRSNRGHMMTMTADINGYLVIYDYFICITFDNFVLMSTMIITNIKQTRHMSI